MFIEKYNCDFLLSKLITLNQFIILSVVLLFIFLAFFLKHYYSSILVRIGLFTVAVGGLTNLSQWVSKGCVHDYINFFGIFYFNFYDLLVTIGTLLIAISIWKKK